MSPALPVSPAVSPSSREKILEVAEAHFARRGFSGVGLREVARRGRPRQVVASSTTSTARRSSTSRCWSACSGGSRSACSPALARPVGPLERLEGWVDALVDALAEHPTTARLLLRGLVEEEDFPDEPLPEAQRAERLLGAILQGIHGAAARGHRAGRLPAGLGAAHGADADRRHRLPLRVGRGRREHHGPPAALGRGRAPAQAGASQSVASGARGAPADLRPTGGETWTSCSRTTASASGTSR